jgi:hypothetical protein
MASKEEIEAADKALKFYYGSSINKTKINIIIDAADRLRKEQIIESVYDRECLETIIEQHKENND